MIDIQQLIDIDRNITLAINGSDSLFLDAIAHVFTTIWIWIPIALMLVYLFIHNNNSKKLLILLFMLALTVVCCDQFSSSFCKPFFARFRPTRDADILHLVDTVAGYHGGLYGFISSHAANSFGIAVFAVCIVRNRFFTFSIILWAIINSLIRTYLGVHFFGDIVSGAFTGALFGIIFFFLFKFFTREKETRNKLHHYSNNIYTSSGYLTADINNCMCVLYATYILIIFIALISQGIMPL